MEYGQFCPIAKATEIVGEKWTLLIIRELLMGGTRFNELHRGLSLISPTILSRRLDALAEKGLVAKKRIPGQKGYEYFATESCKQLQPIILALGDWGMEWALSNLTDKDYDVEFLMLYLKRSIMPEKLLGRENVFRFKFTDTEDFPNWWLVVSGEEIDLCDKDPGKEIDVYFTSEVKTFVEIWMGRDTYRNAIQQGAMLVVGEPRLTDNITSWMRNAIFTDRAEADTVTD